MFVSFLMWTEWGEGERVDIRIIFFKHGWCCYAVSSSIMDRRYQILERKWIYLRSCAGKKQQLFYTWTFSVHVCYMVCGCHKQPASRWLFTECPRSSQCCVDVGSSWGCGPCCSLSADSSAARACPAIPAWRVFGTVALELAHFSSVNGSCVAPQSHGLIWGRGWDFGNTDNCRWRPYSWYYLATPVSPSQLLALCLCKTLFR